MLKFVLPALLLLTAACAPVSSPTTGMCSCCASCECCKDMQAKDCPMCLKAKKKG